MSGERRSWLADPEAITRRSFEIIAGEADFSHLPADTHHIAARVIHACGQPELAVHLRISPGLQQAAEQALSIGGPIYTDTEMTRAGIMRRLLPEELPLRCLLSDENLCKLAKYENMTLTAKAVDHWELQAKGAVCIIGNAPTALFRLLERIEAESVMPAVVIAFPVGFVGAAESKALLRQFMQRGLKAATLLGRAGGSAMAAAAMNAILLAADTIRSG